jgi:hypothetical protein
MSGLEEIFLRFKEKHLPSWRKASVFDAENHRKDGVPSMEYRFLGFSPIKNNSRARINAPAKE